MTNAELLRRISKASGYKRKECEEILAAFTEIVAVALKEGDNVRVARFGVFEARDRAARKGRNPRTGEPMKVPACKAPFFKGSKALKDRIK